jgi:hypothetical protein
MDTETTTARFHTRFPFAVLEAAEWAYLAHQWLLSQDLNTGMSKIFFPKEVQEQRERGSYRFFLSGGVRIWVSQNRTEGHYGEEWSVTSLRATWPIDDHGGKAEMLWKGDEVCDLCRFHPNNR